MESLLAFTPHVRVGSAAVEGDRISGVKRDASWDGCCGQLYLSRLVTLRLARANSSAACRVAAGLGQP